MTQQTDRIDQLLSQFANTAVSEPESDHHRRIAAAAWERVAPLIRSASQVLDLGAGSGFASELFLSNGHSVLAINYVETDATECINRGIRCLVVDMHYFERHLRAGLWDLVWARHVLEHSPFPMLVLSEIHSVLRPGGLLFMEVPMPGTGCRHEDNPNHYSVLTAAGWESLCRRSGFEKVATWTVKFTAPAGDDEYRAWIWRKTA